MNNLNIFLNALNIEIGKEFNEQENGITFCHNNLIERKKVSREEIGEALNNIDYHHEDGVFDGDGKTFSDADLTALAKVIDAYGADLDLSEVRDKQIWFDV